MSQWVLWGRIEQTGANEWAAIATALDEKDPAVTPKVRMRTAATKAAADTLLKGLLLGLGEEVRAAGGRIVDVETDGL